MLRRFLLEHVTGCNIDFRSLLSEVSENSKQAPPRRRSGEFWPLTELINQFQRSSGLNKPGTSRSGVLLRRLGPVFLYLDDGVAREVILLQTCRSHSLLVQIFMVDLGR